MELSRCTVLSYGGFTSGDLNWIYVNLALDICLHWQDNYAA